MGFITKVPLTRVHVILIGYEPSRLFNNFHRVSCLWDWMWIVGDFLSILFIETEATAMMFMDSADICSESSELRPNGIGSELGGRPEILQMGNNPQQPALPNPHEAPTTSNAPQSMPHKEQEAELAHPAPNEASPDVSPSPPSSSFFKGLENPASSPEPGEEVQQPYPMHSISKKVFGMSYPLPLQ